MNLNRKLKSVVAVVAACGMFAVSADTASAAARAYWNFDADNNLDVLGNHNVNGGIGTITYAAAPGAFGKAAVFDGASHFTVANIENLADVSVGSFTYRFTSTDLAFAGVNNHNVALEMQTAAVGVLQFSAGQSHLVASPGGHLNMVGTATGVLESASNTVATNTWYTALWIEDGTGWKVSFKADGGGVSTPALTVTASGSGFFAALNPVASDILTIGHAFGHPGRFMKGQMDEIAIFDHALTTGEQATLFSSGVGALIPEPASLSLLAMGGLMMLRRRR